MNKKKLMAMALAASIAVGGVATPFTSFAAEGDGVNPPVEEPGTEHGLNETEKPAPAPAPNAEPGTDKEKAEKELQAAAQRLAEAIGNARTALNQNENKSPNTIADLRAAIDKAEAVLNDNANRTVESLNSATASVKAATTKLVNAPDENELQAAVQRLSETIGRARTALNQNENKSPNTIADLRAAIDKAEAVLNDNANRTVTSLNEATKSVEAATKKLVDAPDEKEFQAAVFELSETIGKARAALNENTKKTKEETDALRKVIDEADAYLNDNAKRTLSGIVATTSKVKEATEKFVKSPDIKEDTEENRKEAKRELLANLQRGRKYLRDKKYTKESRAKLAAAIRNGYAVYKNSGATLEEIKAATKAAFDAIYNLELVDTSKEVNVAKRELLANIERGEEYLNNKRYTKASRAKLANAIKAGRAVYNDKDATLAQVLEANGSVFKAIYDLKLVKPITSVEEAKRELQANLERGKLYVNSKLYTKASRARLASAIRDGYAVLYNSNASLRDVLKANGRVVKAIYNLELVKGKKPVKKARKVLPQTGVESMSAMAMAAAALVGAGLVASKKRK